MRVAYLAGGFPSDDNPSHGIFNLRAAMALSGYVELEVIHYRAFKPGRKFYSIHKENNYRRHVLCIPIIPVFGSRLYWINNLIFREFTFFFVGKLLLKCDVVHASDGNLSVFAGQLKEKCHYKLLAQFIGGDINQDLNRQVYTLKRTDWFSKLDAITFNSDSIKNEVGRLFGSHDNGHTIYRGVDVSRYKARSSYNNGRIVFYFLGGLPNYRTFKHGRNTKGGRTLMQAWGLLDEAGKTQNIELLFGGPDSDIGEVRKWKSSLKYQDRVRIIGSITPEQVENTHLTGNVCIAPSIEEGLPNVVMEACSSGNMVIASKVGGIPEVIEHRVNGVLIQPDDPKTLASEISRLIEEPDVIETYGSNARRTMISKFNSRSFGPRYFEIYRLISQNESIDHIGDKA